MKVSIIELYTELDSKKPARVFEDVVRVVHHDIPGFVVFQCQASGRAKDFVVDMSAVELYIVTEKHEMVVS